MSELHEGWCCGMCQFPASLYGITSCCCKGDKALAEMAIKQGEQK